jgi:hypothetical protein
MIFFSDVQGLRKMKFVVYLRGFSSLLIIHIQKIEDVLFIFLLISSMFVFTQIGFDCFLNKKFMFADEQEADTWEVYGYKLGSEACIKYQHYALKWSLYFGRTRV